MISKYHYTKINLKHFLIIYIILLICIILLTIFCKYIFYPSKIENIEDELSKINL